MISSMLIVLCAGGMGSPITIQEDPPALFYVFREPKKVGESVEGECWENRCRLYMYAYDTTIGGPDNYFVCQSDDAILNNVSYLAGPQWIASALLPKGKNTCTIRLTDLKGEVKREILGVHGIFSVNAEGTKIVYMTGKIEGDPFLEAPGFVSTGTWIMDVESGKTEKINSGGADVYWSKKNGSIYISPEETFSTKNGFNEATKTFDKTVLRYDPATGKTTPTVYGSCRFSSGESYYVAMGRSKDMAFTIHKTATNEEIGHAIPYIGNGGCVYLPDRWVSDTLLVVDSYVIDVSAGTVIKCPGKVSSARLSGTYLILGYYGNYRWGGNKTKRWLIVRDLPSYVERIPLEKIPDLKPQDWTPFAYSYCNEP